MIDLHNHVLPGIDDGSKSLEISLNMLRCAADQGITDVVNTVHLQHPKVDDKITYQLISEATIRLQEELYNRDIPIILHIGSEVFFLTNLTDIKSNQLSTIGNGKYMLIEFQLHYIPEVHKQVLFDLKIGGVTPIIAHPERYRAVQENTKLVYYWLNAGCLIQIDAGSLLGLFGKSAKRAAEEIIKNNYCHILGSDAHDDRKRNFCLKDAYNIAQNLIGDNARLMVFDNPRAVLAGKPIKVDYEIMQEKTPSLWEKYFKRYTKRFSK